MDRDIGVEVRPGLALAVVRTTTTRAEVSRLWKPMLDEVWTLIGRHPELKPIGHNVMVYRESEADGPIAFEVGVAVGGRVASEGNVVPSELPPGPVAVTLHVGAPEDLPVTHEAVRTWCAQTGLAVTGMRWEIYGDPEPDTHHFDVEVVWQLRD